jgi:hypothetical protein
MSAATAELASATVATPVKINFFTWTPKVDPKILDARFYIISRGADVSFLQQARKKL